MPNSPSPVAMSPQNVVAAPAESVLHGRRMASMDTTTMSTSTAAVPAKKKEDLLAYQQSFGFFDDIPDDMISLPVLINFVIPKIPVITTRVNSCGG